MSAPVTPEVLWAQRSSVDDKAKNFVCLTITASDIREDSMKVELTSDKLCFQGENNNRKYALELEFYAEIDETLSKTHHSGRGVEFILRKKEIKSEYWPRLSKEPKKLQFIKTDFDKWVDEDEQDDAEDPPSATSNDMDDMDNGMGLDFAKMMGQGGSGNLDMANIMQGLGGSGGMGGPSEDDDDMPELEDISKDEQKEISEQEEIAIEMDASVPASEKIEEEK